MAISRIGQRAATTSAAATTHSIPITANTVQNNTLILTGRMAGSATINSITDSQSNTWTVDRQMVGTTGTFYASAKLTTALTTLDAISVNISAATAFRYSAYEYSGLADPLAADVGAASGLGTSVTTQTAGPTATTAQASELALSTLATNVAPGTITYPTGYAQIITTVSLHSVAEKILSATGTETPVWSWTTAGNAVVMVQTYKAATVVSGANQALMTMGVG